MTPEMNWNNILSDQVKPMASFDVFKYKELRENYKWKNTQPLMKKDNLQKFQKNDFLDHRLQYIKAYKFLRLNEKGLKQNFH